METKHKIYYAHSKLSYNTSQEAVEIQFLRKKFSKAKVICPNNDLGELKDFNEYLKIVDSCSQVIVSEYDGYIGRGVLCETIQSFINNKPVFVLRKRGSEFNLLMVTGFELTNQNDWKNRYAKLIVKQ